MFINASMAYASHHFHRVEAHKCYNVNHQTLSQYCALIVTGNKQSHIFVVDKEEFKHRNPIREHDIIEIDLKKLKKVEDLESRVLLHKAFKGQPYYIKDLYYLDLNQAYYFGNQKSQTTHNLRCKGGFIDDEFYGNMDIKAELRSFSYDHFELANTSLDYSMYSSEFGDVISAERFENGTFKNRYNYRPYVYKGHLKFESLFYDKMASGFIDLVIPRDFATKTTFMGKVIMSHINDSMGATIKIQCSVSEAQL